MKKTHMRRPLSLLLALVLCLALAPAVRAEDAEPEYWITGGPSSHILETRKEPRSAVLTLKTRDSSGSAVDVSGVFWSSSNTSVATVHYSSGQVTAVGAGEATITAELNGKKFDWYLQVSGIAVKKDKVPVVVYENGATQLDTAIDFFGVAEQKSVYFTSRNPTTAEVNGHYVMGLQVGNATVDAVSNYGDYSVTIPIQVKPDLSTRIPQDEEDKKTLPLRGGEPLPFRDLDSYFNSQVDGKVDYVTGLFVPTNQGTLYYDYMSESEPGSGVGQIETYYRHPGAGQRALTGVTFVPKPGYAGNATITYNAITTEGKTYSCKIVLTIQGSSSPGDDSAAGSISVRTTYNTAVQFDSMEFGSVCREKLGVQLEYAIFAQPPERQGALYTNYSASGSYGSLVDIHSQYSRKQIDDIWFVPAPGYRGTVVVYYTGYGTNGRSYTGQILIQVGQEGTTASGLLSYDVAPGGVCRFDDTDFDDYCKRTLDSSQTLSGIRFESLPSEGDGVLYYEYQSALSPGSRAAAGTVYYTGTRAPRINRLAFVPSGSFTGSLRLPFTGWTTDGTSFSGGVEINVRGGAVTGDIFYTCAPGRSVSFLSDDFTSLSHTLTGSTLNYIQFLELPSSTEGSLYYGSSRASTGTPYSNSNIGRLSFRAANTFIGPVHIPFEGYSRQGNTFTGLITIESTGSGLSSGNIRYTTDWKSAARFDRDDFDEISRSWTGWTVSSVRFDLPSSGQGTLYRNYYSSSNRGTSLASNYSVSASGLDRVAFIPASGYSGTVYIGFTATAAGSGGSFTGTVEIEVTAPPSDATARYSTRTEAVRFYADDLARSGYRLSSIRFTSLPPASAGYLYYQYTSPIRYGQQVGTGTVYRTSGNSLISDLAFVPRAGYSGTVIIPYTGTNSNNSTFTGEVVITVSPSYSSSYFSDMGNYSNAQRAAVDFLYNHGITNGLITGQYGPDNSIRRGDFALMLYRAFEMSPTSSAGAFVDVSPSAYYAEAVNALYTRGVVSGVGNGYYAPDSTLTRQDAICMVQRAMRAVGWNANDGPANALTAYGDSGSVSSYAQGAMALAIQRGYLPTSVGMLNPQQPLTRVDMAEVLHRVLTY